MTKHRPVPASLDDPLYYLENMDILVAWVANHHADLLTEQERNRLAAFSGLATGPRALLTRMVMRTGELFRSDKLRYPELPVPESEALRILVQAGWLDPAPELSVDDLFRLFTLAELRPVFADWLQQQGHPKTLGKARMRELMAEPFNAPRALGAWLPGGGAGLRSLRRALLHRGCGAAPSGLAVGGQTCVPANYVVYYHKHSPVRLCRSKRRRRYEQLCGSE